MSNCQEQSQVHFTVSGKSNSVPDIVFLENSTATTDDSIVNSFATANDSTVISSESIPFPDNLMSPFLTRVN